LSFTSAQATELLTAFAARHPDAEAAVLSTCNRTEFLIAAPEDSGALGALLALVRMARPNAPIHRPDLPRYELLEDAAAHHLFRVAAGLDSAILGDLQILGQVRSAAKVAEATGTLGPILRQLFEQATKLGRHVRTHTAISRGAASVGSAIADIASRRLTAVSNPRIIVIGLGDTGKATARSLVKRGYRNLLLINRTQSRAQPLAAGLGVQVAPWEELSNELANAHCAVLATGASEPILGLDLLHAIAERRSDAELLIIDAGLPRNVAPGGPFQLIDIDDIRSCREAGLDQRRAAVPDVERMCAQRRRTWCEWRVLHPVETLLADLYSTLPGHIAWGTEELCGDEPDERVERIIRRTVRRALHGHVAELRRMYVDQILGDAR